MMIGGEHDVVQAPRSDLQDARSRHRRHSRARPGREKARRHRRARLSALRPQRRAATSSRWSTTASSTASWPPMPKAWTSCKHANVGKQKQRDRCRNHAAARSRALSVRLQSARRRRGLAARQRDRLVAARSDGGRARCRIRSWRNSPAASPIRAKAAGRSRPPSTKRVPAPVLTAALYERFSSRGEADFADKLLSAMRYQFGGHLEKPAGKRAG